MKMGPALIAPPIQEGNHGKVNRTFIAKVMFAQMPVLQLSPTLTLQMVLANNVPEAQFQASQMPMALEYHVSTPQLVEAPLLAQDAFNTEIIKTDVKHVLEPKFQTSIEMDVVSEPIASPTSTMTPVTNAKPALPVLLSMLLLTAALLLLL
jgi:hypothetical protein